MKKLKNQDCQQMQMDQLSSFNLILNLDPVSIISNTSIHWHTNRNIIISTAQNNLAISHDAFSFHYHTPFIFITDLNYRPQKKYNIFSNQIIDCQSHNFYFVLKMNTTWGKLSMKNTFSFPAYLCLCFLDFSIIIMSKNTNRTRKIPKFIKKLKQILQDENFFHLITWVPENNGFQIIDASRFIDQVLPKYFKHKNMASFVRQLNMYGFSRPKESDQNVYTHSRFVKGNLNSMRQIQRRVGDRKQTESFASATQFQESVDLPVENHEIYNFCMKLLEENKSLKKQNSQLTEKLYLLKNQHLRQDNLTLLSNKSDEAVHLTDCTKIPTQNIDLIKSQGKQQKMKKFGFNFAEKHGDWNSRLSYFSLLGGGQTELMSTQ